ncbi:MAG: squalene/phytoene synthase family protein [Granulosicoccus sp.]
MIEIREGSSLYYSMLWLDADSKVRLVNRLSLIDALATTLDDAHEPTVAQQKIHWWHEELDRMQAGKARHPATQLCQDCLAGNEAAKDVCISLLSSVATERLTPLETEEDSNALILQNFQARMALTSHALSREACDLAGESHPSISAMAFGLHERLARLPRLIHRGFPVFSNELYEQFNIGPTELSRHIRVSSAAKDGPPATTLSNIPIAVENPNRNALLTYATNRAAEALNNAVSSDLVIERYRQQPFMPVWRLLILRQHLLKLWRRRQPDLLRERLTLTPLAKLYRVWKHRH